ncbi:MULTISPECIES: hypothetical protein [Aliagarivorans]|uniref:hypothetical protein n=1 Tax=Aliagarivorans TaxID=882379 RepID=UPI00047B7852|nr:MULTISPECIES: hypothetical protein [Aliagarivorans]
MKNINKILSFWRILLLTGISQVAAIAINPYEGHFYSPEVDLWHSGAVYGYWGFIFGLFWHIYTNHHKLKEEMYILAFLLSVATVVFVIGKFFHEQWIT